MNSIHPHTVPHNPADPEAAALDLIVRLPCDMLGAEQFRGILQELSSLLEAAGAFAELSWPDAKQVAAAVAIDVCGRDDAGAFLGMRAQNVRSGSSGSPWDDPQRAAQALDIAAAVMGL